MTQSKNEIFSIKGHYDKFLPKRFHQLLNHSKHSILNFLDTCSLDTWDLAWANDTHSDQTEWSERYHGQPDVYQFHFKFQDISHPFNVHTNDPVFIAELLAAVEGNLELPYSKLLMKTGWYLNDLKTALRSRYNDNDLLVKEEFNRLGLLFPEIGFKQYDHNPISDDDVLRLANRNALSMALDFEKEGRLQHFAKAKIFKIPDSGKTDKAVCDLDFYQWMTDQPDLKHSTLITMKEYIDYLGFNRETHRIVSEDKQMMKYAIDQHYRDGLAASKPTPKGPTALQELKFTTLEGLNVVLVTDVKKSQYPIVKTALEGLGGKWDRRVQAFVFPSNQSALLEQVKAGKKVNLEREFKKRTNFFATPRSLGDKMAADLLAHFKHTNGIRLLEPSAGKLGLVKACLGTELVFANQFDVCEFEKEFRDDMLGTGVNVVGDDFLKYNVDGKIRYDAIIANPPFSNDRDYHHLVHMISMMARGGILKAIIGSNLRQRTKDLLTFWNAVVVDIPAGEFRESGTNVSTIEVTITF